MSPARSAPLAPEETSALAGQRIPGPDGTLVFHLRRQIYGAFCLPKGIGDNIHQIKENTS